MAKPKDPHRHPTVPDDPLQFTEAIAALRDRVPMTEAEFDELTEAEQEYAFTIANVTQADLVADAYEAIERAVRDGTTFEDFKDDVGDALEESWGGEIPGRLETIFRTNVQGAYNTGRYRQMTAPAVADARPYWRFDGVRDGATSKDICLPIIKAGVVLAADDPWWNGHYPPLHPNCFPAGVIVETPAGGRPIESLRVGDLVLSHDGRHHAVSRVFVSHYKGSLRVIRHGQQILHVTANHPVATKDRWVAADSLNVDRDQLWILKRSPSVPDDSPSVGHGKRFKFRILDALAGSPVPLSSVQLNGDSRSDDCNIGVERLHGELHDVVNAETAKRLGHRLFVFARRLSLLGLRAAHKLLDRGLAATSRAVGRNGLRSLLGITHRAIPSSVVLGDGSHDAGRRQDTNDRSTATAVSDGQRPCGLPPSVQRDDFLLGQDHLDRHAFSLSVFDSRAAQFTGIVFNLEVEGSRTFVANGVLVHNCRSIATPLTEDEAKAEGITRSPPRVDPVSGFGDAPSVTGTDWKPDPEDYPEPIAAELEDGLAETG